MYILAIDPGGTTGVVGLQDGRIHLLHEYNLKPGRDESLPETAHLVALLLQGLKAFDPVVAIENFIGAGPRSPYAAPTLQLIGFVRGYCRLIGLTVVVQNPQERRSCHTHASELVRDYVAQNGYHSIAGTTAHLIDAAAHGLRAREALSHGTKP